MPPLSTGEHVVKLAMHPAGKLLAGITDKCKSSYNLVLEKRHVSQFLTVVVTSLESTCVSYNQLCAARVGWDWS